MLLFYFIWIVGSRNVMATEVVVSSHNKDTSLGITIYLPVLTCHAKHQGYHSVFWHKDCKLLRNGSTEMSDHMLFLSDLVTESIHPLKLQGYFWCDTDVPSIIHKYLFRIKEVNTYIGRLQSWFDSLTNHNEEGNEEEKLKRKKNYYETKMESILFGFLYAPNTYVTDIREHEGGLAVTFFLYSRKVIDPRERPSDSLYKDENELDDIMAHINNRTEHMDAHLYREIIQWTKKQGISVLDITLVSTLGCYSQKTKMNNDPSFEITWPYAYMGDVVIPEESCSSKEGMAVTRSCMGSFNSGAKWGNPSGKCNAKPNKLTTELKQLQEKFKKGHKAEYIERLLELKTEVHHFTVTDIHIVLSILTELSNSARLQSQEVREIFSVLNTLVGTNTTELVVAKNTILLTKRFLGILDNLLDVMRNQEIFLAGKHLLAEVKSTEVSPNHVVGIAVVSSPSEEKSLESSSVEFLLNGSKGPEQDSIAYFYLPDDLVVQRETELPFPCRVQVVFFRDQTIFTDPKRVLIKKNYRILSTPVLMVSLSGGPAWNLTNPVELYFKHTYAAEIEHPVCVYFDPNFNDGSWSTEGCEYVGMEEGFHRCRCHHLSIFAVILSVSPETGSVVYELGTVVYVGVSVSIIALLFIVILYLLSKTWRKTVDHSILFHLSLSFFLFLVLIFISEIKFRWKSGCFVLSLLLNKSILLVFFWLLVHALVHKMRFAKKTDMSEVPHFIIKAVVCVWGAAASVILVVWYTRDYKYYSLHSCWAALTDTTRAALIPVVVTMLAVLCINLCASYAINCRFKKDYLSEDSMYHESVIKFRVAFSIFFLFILCWLFGFFALRDGKMEMEVLFSISITLTSYYLALFFVFQETSLWEMVKTCTKSHSSSSGENVQFVAKQ